MADLKVARENLEKKGYTAKLFETGEQASAYINGQIDATSVAIGGMKTAEQLGLFDSLAEHNEVIWHWRQDAGEALPKAMTTDCYITSANALSEDGTIVCIDHVGNRLSSILYGHRKVYFVIGVNKLVDTADDAVWRARNIAAPKRAKSMGKKTPCVFKGKCFDCKSPDRVCNGMLIMMMPMGSCEMEVILINEELGM